MPRLAPHSWSFSSACLRSLRRSAGTAALLVAAFAAALAAGAGAQTQLQAHNGAGAGDLFGYSVGAVGDVNGDGRADVIVGARDASPGGLALAGTATVYSGLDGSTLFTLTGDSAGDSFGVAVAGIGDMDGDGFPDVAVGASFDDTTAFANDNVGSVRVFSGRTGIQLLKILGPQGFDTFGASVGPAGDWNADGVPDIVAGALNFTANLFGTMLPRAGYVGVYSGANGALIKSFNGIAKDENFGWSVDGGQDIDGDGFPDIVVGTPGGSTGLGGVAGHAQMARSR